MLSVYSFKVSMEVHVFETSEDLAREQLDKSGGYVTHRDIELVASTNIPTTDLSDETSSDN
jgi:hypothetical protein